MTEERVPLGPVTVLVKLSSPLPYALAPDDVIFVPELGTVEVGGLSEDGTVIAVSRMSGPGDPGAREAYWEPRWEARREVVHDGEGRVRSVIHAFEIGVDGPSETTVCGIPPSTPKRPVGTSPVRNWHSLSLDFGEDLPNGRCRRCWDGATLAAPGGGPWPGDFVDG